MLGYVDFHEYFDKKFVCFTQIHESGFKCKILEKG